MRLNNEFGASDKNSNKIGTNAFFRKKSVRENRTEMLNTYKIHIYFIQIHWNLYLRFLLYDTLLLIYQAPLSRRPLYAGAKICNSKSN